MRPKLRKWNCDQGGKALISELELMGLGTYKRVREKEGRELTLNFWLGVLQIGL